MAEAELPAGQPARKATARKAPAAKKTVAKKAVAKKATATTSAPIATKRRAPKVVRDTCEHTKLVKVQGTLDRATPEGNETTPVVSIVCASGCGATMKFKSIAATVMTR